MEWTADVSAGDWLRERIDDPWRGTMHDVVPRGFAAYARVFHPSSVQGIPGERMPSLAAWREMDWQQHEPLMARIQERPARWSEAADAFGTVFHPTAQWDRLVRAGDRGAQVESADGRWWNAPMDGTLPSDTVPVLAEHLAAHTSAPHDGYVALWEGHGGLVGHLGVGPSRTFFQPGDPHDPALQRHNEMLGRSVRDVWNNVFRKSTWQDGLLSREISEGPRFALPGRSHVLFRGGVADLARPDWVLHVPWRDRIAEGHGFDPAAISPGILWPDDRAWVLVTDVDHDSTIVGGPAELVAALVADPRLEAVEVAEGIALTDDADEINR
ncbi:hypothetical protein AB3M83_01485 [Microbacterium sp. 179-B 1A2 NHS]|uniref:hypothetical protein n=1 Tax=Microbacterium sp. 179-B 1A2 NHS TaxID=3142383 RepID=UPI0039A18898